MLTSRQSPPAQTYTNLLDRFATWSFDDYKIDYSRCLGEGSFGKVYELVIRPENEKGFFSSWFPYLYDSLFPVSTASESPREYCVKIFKTTCRHINLRASFSEVIEMVKVVNAQPSLEANTNKILRKHGISHVNFFKTFSYYSQFKSLIKGKTLYFYAENNLLTNENQFDLRKSLIEFFSKISKTRLNFIDFHDGNIMYDEINKRWEVIDGEVIESEENQDILSTIPQRWWQHNLKLKILTEILIHVAKNNIPYGESQDQLLLECLEKTNIAEADVEMLKCEIAMERFPRVHL